MWSENFPGESWVISRNRLMWFKGCLAMLDANLSTRCITVTKGLMLDMRRNGLVPCIDTLISISSLEFEARHLW